MKLPSVASLFRCLLPTAIAAALVSLAPDASSQQNDSPVIRLLQTAHDTRTRVQAALTLGRLRPPGARDALENALDDHAAAVRAAAVQALVMLADPSARPVLIAHENDSDPGVRSGIVRALAQLPGSSPPANAVSAAPAIHNGSARFVLQLGRLSDHAGARPGTVDVLRDAIVSELSHEADVMIAVGSVLPPEAEQRVRAGHARMYALEGTVNSLRRWTVATTLSVRAEVSLILMTNSTHAIVGSLSGAATAQDHTPYYDPDGFTRRLEQRALAAAVHGALGNLQNSLYAVR